MVLNRLSAGVPPRTPLRELTALPRPLAGGEEPKNPTPALCLGFLDLETAYLPKSIYRNPPTAQHD